jgi:hypothetical protein
MPGGNDTEYVEIVSAISSYSKMKNEELVVLYLDEKGNYCIVPAG